MIKITRYFGSVLREFPHNIVHYFPEALCPASQRIPKPSIFFSRRPLPLFSRFPFCLFRFPHLHFPFSYLPLFLSRHSFSLFTHFSHLPLFFFRHSLSFFSHFSHLPLFFFRHSLSFFS